MLKMTQKRQRKGFTLVELMIVIAVIAILAAVLIPKAGMVQSSAKESGVEANLRTVQGLIQGMTHRETTGAAMRTYLISRLGTAVKNPITNNTGASATAADPNAVLVVETVPASITGTNFVGKVIAVVPSGYWVENSVYLIPCDKDGNEMTGARVLIP